MMYYSYINEQEALIHYGTLGMKWGHRPSDPNPNDSSHHPVKGTRDIDKIMEYTTPKERKAFRSEMIEYYTQLGVKEKANYYRKASDREIAEDIHRKQMVKKALLIGLGVAGVGVGLYIGYKAGALQYISDNLRNNGINLSNLSNLSKSSKGITKDLITNDLVEEALRHAGEDIDVVLQPDGILHRMEGYRGRDIANQKGVAYVAGLKDDIVEYKYLLKDWHGTGERFDTVYKITKEIKIPAREQAESILNELLANDPTYKVDLGESLYRGWAKHNPHRAKLIDKDQFLKAAYPQGFTFHDMIYGLVQPGSATDKAAAAFQSKGYDALIDYFDAGTFTSKPLIILDPANTVTKIGEERVHMDSISGYLKAEKIYRKVVGVR